jgi:hypothetical protein
MVDCDRHTSGVRNGFHIEGKYVNERSELVQLQPFNDTRFTPVKSPTKLIPYKSTSLTEFTVNTIHRLPTTTYTSTHPVDSSPCPTITALSQHSEYSHQKHCTHPVVHFNCGVVVWFAGVVYGPKVFAPVQLDVSRLRHLRNIESFLRLHSCGKGGGVIKPIWKRPTALSIFATTFLL